MDLPFRVIAMDNDVMQCDVLTFHLFFFVGRVLDDFYAVIRDQRIEFNVAEAGIFFAIYLF